MAADQRDAARRESLAIAVDVGGTKIAAAVIDASGDIRESVKADTPQTNQDDVVDTISSLIDKLVEPASRSGAFSGIGLSVAGTVDWRNGMIIQSPNLPLKNIALRDVVESRFHILTSLDNDGNLAALGEKYFGAARDAQNIVGLTLGTGIGAGIIIDGKLYRGSGGSAAELGHMVIQADGPPCTCGSRGCFEELASGRALVRFAKQYASNHAGSLLLKHAGGDVSRLTGPMVTDAAEHGDPAALEAFDKAGYWLGVGMNNIINIFNPDVIILGGGMSEAGELVLAPARRVVEQCSLSPNKDIAAIRISRLGNYAGLLGAAALVFGRQAS